MEDIHEAFRAGNQQNASDGHRCQGYDEEGESLPAGHLYPLLEHLFYLSGSLYVEPPLAQAEEIEDRENEPQEEDRAVGPRYHSVEPEEPEKDFRQDRYGESPLRCAVKMHGAAEGAYPEAQTDRNHGRPQNGSHGDARYIPEGPGDPDNEVVWIEADEDDADDERRNTGSQRCSHCTLEKLFGKVEYQAEPHNEKPCSECQIQVVLLSIIIK